MRQLKLSFSRGYCSFALLSLCLVGMLFMMESTAASGEWPRHMEASWNALLRPSRFTSDALGGIAIHRWGPEGAGNFLNDTRTTSILDNRHIHEELKTMLCAEDDAEAALFRDYFSTLIDLAWPVHAELWVCCDLLVGANATDACGAPDLQFHNRNDATPMVLAPHFLTEQFERGQQEALTAGLIAQIQALPLLGKPALEMELRGRLDLGVGGTRFFAENLPGFDHHIGNAWGNAFLDCFGEDDNDILCQASKEVDRTIGRDAQFFGLPLFTCSGESHSRTSCFRSDIADNERDGCGFVAAVGACDRVCVGGFCGVNDPPLEYRGTTNVIYVYSKENSNDSPSEGVVRTTVISVVLVVLVLLAHATFLRWKKKRMRCVRDAVVAANKFPKEITDIEVRETSCDEGPHKPAIV